MSSRPEGELAQANPLLPDPAPQGGRGKTGAGSDRSRPLDGGGSGWGWAARSWSRGRKRSGRRIWLALALGAVVATALGPAAPALGFDRSEVTILASDGKQHRFKVEVARTPDDRARGLMHRRALDADAGMLFDFETVQLVSMWMMNTLIPLDMLFIAADGRIATIAERTVPHSTASILSEVAVRGVLEVNGGTVARLGIKRGDRVRHPIFESR